MHCLWGGGTTQKKIKPQDLRAALFFYLKKQQIKWLAKRLLLESFSGPISGNKFFFKKIITIYLTFRKVWCFLALRSVSSPKWDFGEAGLFRPTELKKRSLAVPA